MNLVKNWPVTEFGQKRCLSRNFGSFQKPLENSNLGYDISSHYRPRVLVVVLVWKMNDVELQVCQWMGMWLGCDRNPGRFGVLISVRVFWLDSMIILFCVAWTNIDTKHMTTYKAKFFTTPKASTLRSTAIINLVLTSCPENSPGFGSMDYYHQFQEIFCRLCIIISHTFSVSTLSQVG